MASHPSEGYNLAFRPKSAAVSKGYNFASSWEQNAPLTEEAHAAVISLSHAVAERPFPLKLSQEQHVEQENVVPDFQNMSEASWPTDAVLVNSHEFYKWFTDLESATKSEWEEKYRQYVSTLKQRIQTCDEVLSQVDSTLNFFNELQLQQQAVAANTKTLHDACEQLLDEKKRLTDFAEAIRSKLNYFDELENVAAEFYSPSMNVGNQRFLPLLKRLDECILYVESNPQYAESSVYLVKFRQLQSRALSMVRSHVLSVLKNASLQVTTAIKETGGITAGVEASVLYVRFKASAGELRPVMEELESRASRKEYTQLLSECQQLYCEQRRSLIKGIVQQKITEFSRKELLPQLTRSGCAYLVEVCQLENRLFDHFFPSSTDAASLAPLIDPLCTYLYDTLRPKLIHEVNLDFLCDLIDILKVEVLGEQPGRSVESVAGIQPTVLRIVADVHERLTFRAQTYVRNEIANYIPFDEDLDYPAKLEKLKNSQLDNNVDEKMRAFSTWYPTLQKALTCLEKLYHRLEPTVFTGLAQEVVEVCSTSIQKASKLITKRSSTMDGQLFLIKHLLILREQIANFEIEFSVTHKELDFAHLLEHLRRLLRGQASLFDWSRSSSLARTLSSTVLENQIDAKKELEKCLKATCEEFIMSVTKIVVDPMLSFVTKVAAVKVALSSGNQAQRIDSVLTKPLKDQAFASPEKVSELVQKVDNEIQQELPKVMEKMKLYLQNPSTRAIIFKPIKANILEAHIQVHKLIESEYTPEEAKSIGMVKTELLQEQLERTL